MSWYFKQHVFFLFFFLFQAEHIRSPPFWNRWVQGHDTQRCGQTQAFTHPQASTNTIFCFLPHVHTHTHSVTCSVYPHTHIKSERAVLTAERCQLLGSVFHYDKQVVQHSQRCHWTVPDPGPHTSWFTRPAHNKTNCCLQAAITVRKYSRSIIHYINDPLTFALSHLIPVGNQIGTTPFFFFSSKPFFFLLFLVLLVSPLQPTPRAFLIVPSGRLGAQRNRIQ